jgi:hypothetical protein
VTDNTFKRMDTVIHAQFIRDQASHTHNRELHASVIPAATGTFSLKMVLVNLAENGPEHKPAEVGVKYVDQTFALPEKDFSQPVSAFNAMPIQEAMVI